MKLQIAVVGLRRRHLYGRTHHSVLSATVQVAGPGGGRGGVQLHHKIPQLARIAFEQCPTGLRELGVKPPLCSGVCDYCKNYATVWRLGAGV